MEIILFALVLLTCIGLLVFLWPLCVIVVVIYVLMQILGVI